MFSLIKKSVTLPFSAAQPVSGHLLPSGAAQTPACPTANAMAAMPFPLLLSTPQRSQSLWTRACSTAEKAGSWLQNQAFACKQNLFASALFLTATAAQATQATSPAQPHHSVGNTLSEWLMLLDKAGLLEPVGAIAAGVWVCYSLPVGTLVLAMAVSWSGRNLPKKTRVPDQIANAKTVESNPSKKPPGDTINKGPEVVIVGREDEGIWEVRGQNDQGQLRLFRDVFDQKVVLTPLKKTSLFEERKMQRTTTPSPRLRTGIAVVVDPQQVRPATSAPLSHGDFVEYKDKIYFVENNQNGRLSLKRKVGIIGRGTKSNVPAQDCRRLSGQELATARADFPLGAVLGKYRRYFPEGGSSDTGMFNRTSTGTMILHNLHAGSKPALFIKDTEIIRIQIGPGRFATKLHEDILYGTTADGRHVAKQYGWRGCVAACTLMLTMDHGRQPDIDWLETCNLSDDAGAICHLGKAGLKGKSFLLQGRDRTSVAQQLEQLLSKNGPGILSICGEIGGHVVMLDAFSLAQNRAVIRDPYHGWSIEVTADAVLARGPSGLVQVISH